MKIICNPVSFGGKARKDWPKVVKVLKDEKFDFEVEWTKGINDAVEIVKRSVDEHDLFIVYGGDGTVNEVVTGIGQTGFKSTMGIIPVGRGNDNAFNIRQTDKIEDIVEMLKAKEERVIDCIDINDGERYCMGVAGAGIDSVVADRTYGKSSRIVYTTALIRSILTYRPRHMHIDIDDGREIIDCKSLITSIGNGQRVGNGKFVTPNAIIDDGLLDVVIVGNTGVIDTLLTSRKLADGSHLSHPKVYEHRGKKVVLSTDSTKRLVAHAMGEILGPLPHTFVCKHKVLKVLKMPDKILEREGWLYDNTFSSKK
jgi:diacylglycerol kinase (ATP)